MGKRLPLDQDVRYLKGVGPKRAKELGSLGVETVRDLFDYFPFRIQDFSQIKKICDLGPGDEVTISGKIVNLSTIPGRQGQILRAGVSDGSGICYLVWYNMSYMAKTLHRGMQIVASGKVEWRRQSWEMAHPLLQQSAVANGRGPVLAVYHSTAGLSSSVISRIICDNLDPYLKSVEELLPREIIARHGLMSERDAYENIHRPSTSAKWEIARKTFAFREVFLQQMALLMMKKENEAIGPVPTFTHFSLPRAFVESLPFELTRAQARTVEDIRQDLSSPKIMNRLVQGDVGSGKTVVAIWALLAAVNNGYQGAFLAPTEILARQHYDTFQELSGEFAKVGFLSGNLAPSEKEDVLDSVAAGSTDILIGTHAMLEPYVKWSNLGLIVTDEQHRFGVKQRLNLSYGVQVPHVLVMSATPIPRSLALTIYGDLDISVIDELPHGDNKVQTRVINHRDRKDAYAVLREEVQKGHQAYVICPQISEGKLGRKSVEHVYKELNRGYLRGIEIGLAHGGMPKDLLAQQMRSFAEGLIKVLVATTVVEVGIDVPNATCVVIEGAESFGLATLHQLRGRVGRGGQQAFCIVIPSSEGTSSMARLKTFENVLDGFQLAEIDLLQRGPGQFFGVRQHGMGNVNVKDLGVTVDIIVRAREEARRVIDAIGREGETSYEYELLVNEVRGRFGDLAQHARSR